MLAAAISVAAVVTCGLASAQELLNVTLNKSEMLRITGRVSAVIIGRSDIADVSMENPHLMLISGKSIGETNLFVLDPNGREIARYNIVVIPEDDRQVTVNRSADVVETYSCSPRCIIIKNPTEVSGAKAAAAAAAAAPAAVPSPSPAAAPQPEAPAAGTSGKPAAGTSKTGSAAGSAAQ